MLFKKPRKTGSVLSAPPEATVPGHVSPGPSAPFALSIAVRIINFTILVLAVLLIVAVYWFAFRPLPKLSGEITLPVNSDAIVKRDARGIPHIEAASWQDAIFLQGFVTAQDRLWQMDVLRRLGSGQLAEVFGEAALNSDVHSRRMRMRATAESYVPKLRPQDREVLEQYARGVNAFIDAHHGSYSLEFSLPGHAYEPKKWEIADSLVIGLVMYRTLADNADFELSKQFLMARALSDRETVLTLFPVNQGSYVLPGSNAWAVSGAHTADGKPLVANDPHLAYGIPPTWHLVHLKAPGLNVSGAALPGVPCVITGHNNQIAWGVTNLEDDAMDLYEEQIDQSTGKYMFAGEQRQATADKETIAVKGRSPVDLTVWITGHGPLLITGKQSYSMRWPAADGFGFPFFDVDRAQNWGDFRKALSAFWGPAQNFVYGDKAGNIGFQATGRLPIRRGFTGDIPLDGASGKFEWAGYIPFDDLPSILNPVSGIVATANQNPFPPGFPYQVDGSYADRYRVEQIRSRLSAKNELTVNDMIAVQKDVYSAYDTFLAKQAIAAFEKRGGDQSVRDAVELLRRWDGQMDRDEPAPFITQLLSEEVGQDLVVQMQIVSALKATKGQAGKRGILTSRPAPILPHSQVIQRMLEQRPKGWVFKDDWDGWLLANLTVALKNGRLKQGSPMSKWRWGRERQWSFQHPVGKQLPFVDRFFNIGPVPMSGSATTVKQTTATIGPSERMVVDLGDLDKSVQNLTTGESGFVASGHYKDEWPSYLAGQSFPMQFDRVDAKETLHVHPAK